MKDVALQVSEAIEVINDTLDQAFPFILVEGEVAGFKINQGKFAFFDVKDESGSLGCFMMAFQLKFPLEEGMKVRILAQPKVTAWGKFSLTVREVMPVGEGSLKKSFELLKAKLEKEGLFDETRKRMLPSLPVKIGVISSSQAAGYADFIKILSNRWGGLEITLVDVPVQGMEAPAQIIGALAHLNELSEPLDVVAVIRGGGSADDLSAFNHEDVVRAIASSRTPVIVGVGHEVDISLSDLAADLRAATPSNAAELLVPDKQHVLAANERILRQITKLSEERLNTVVQKVQSRASEIEERAFLLVSQKNEQLKRIKMLLSSLSPEATLKRGYAIVHSARGIVQKKSDVILGETLGLQVADGTINAKVVE